MLNIHSYKIFNDLQTTKVGVSSLACLPVLFILSCTQPWLMSSNGGAVSGYGIVVIKHNVPAITGIPTLLTKNVWIRYCLDNQTYLVVVLL